MSRDSIELSPKYGVNPTIPVCFWCGKEKGEIALMGRVRKKQTRNTAQGTRSTETVDNDVQAPTHMVLNYEPCECCKENFKKGVHLVEVTPHAEDERPAFTKSDNDTLLYPTGRCMVVTPEGARKVFGLPDDMLEAGKKLCLDTDTFDQLMSAINQPNDNI